jgi:glucose/arabinose dehydrogenase
MPLVVPAALVSLLVSVVACGGSSSPPPSNGGSSGTGGTLTGGERIAWTQSAESAADLAGYRYALYVDNVRRVIEGPTCTAGDGISVNCSASLPALSAGRHTLQLAAFFMAGDAVIEGERSPVLEVTVAGATAPASGQIVRGGTFVSSDGLTIQASVLARDLLDPVDLAIAPDGRAFVAERSGRLRIITDGSAAGSQDENVLDMLGEAPSAEGHGLRSIALSPDFSESGTLFVAYLTADRQQPALRIVRLRETSGLIGQPAHIASHAVSADDVAAIVRFGPDAMLHIGIGSGSNDRDAQNLSAASGKILRLRNDGTTPGDNPSASPVLSTGHSDPRGLAWLANDRSLWEIEPADGGDEVNRIRTGGNYGWGIRRSSNAAAAATPPLLVLPDGSEASGLTIVNASEHPLSGNLIVSTLAARDLLRFRFDSTGQPGLSGRLLDARYGRIAQVVSGLDGALFLITANRDEWGAGNDVLVRLRTLRHAPSKVQ